MNITTVALSGYRESALTNDDIQTNIREIMDLYLKMGLCAMAVCTNAVNILIFARIGFSDSVTVAFCGLAVSDMGFCFFTFLLQLCFYLHITEGQRPYVNLFSLGHVLNTYGFMFWDISISVTVFNALQKTACVVIPLLFKSMFTRNRALVIVGMIYLLVIAYYMPMLTMHWLSPKLDITLNRTRLLYTSRSYSLTLTDIMLVFNRFVLPFVAQIIVFVCMFAMTIKLKQASKLRHEMTQNQDTALMDVAETAPEAKDVEAGSKRKNFMSAKELRAVQSVNLVSAIFCICNLPDNIINLCDTFLPEFREHLNTYLLVHAIQNVLACGSAACNILVYYQYNSKYRSKFLQMFKALLPCFKKK